MPTFGRRKRLRQLLELVNLDEHRSKKLADCSGGMQRRLALAATLVHDPELLFLDEPTTGFDPGARRNAWTMIQNLQNLGKTILLTTHYMDEAQALAHRVAIIAKGEIVAEGAPGTLGGRDVAATVVRFLVPARAEPPPEGLVDGLEIRAGAATLRTTTPTAALHDLTGWAVQHGVELQGLSVTRPSLEDVYLELTGASESSDGENEPVAAGRGRGRRRRG
jgi:ABC-2 type transport system ATP-binding protein